MEVKALTVEDFQTEVLDYKGTVLIDFWAAWCGPCKMLSPIIDQVAEERQDIKVLKVNVDEQQELAMKHKVMSIPTLVVYKDGEEVKRSMGAIPKSAVLELLG